MIKFVIRIFIIAIVVSAFLYVINNYHPFYQNDLKLDMSLPDQMQKQGLKRM